MDEWFNLNASIRRAVDPLALMQRVADQAFAALEGADEVLVGLLVGDGSLGLRVRRRAYRRARRPGDPARKQPLRAGPARGQDAGRGRHRDRPAGRPRGEPPAGDTLDGQRPPDTRERGPRSAQRRLTPAARVRAARGRAARRPGGVHHRRRRRRARLLPRHSRLAGEARAGDLRATDLGDTTDEEPRLPGSGLFAPPSTPDSEDDRDAAARAWVEQIVDPGLLARVPADLRPRGRVDARRRGAGALLGLGLEDARRRDRPRPPRRPRQSSSRSRSHRPPSPTCGAAPDRAAVGERRVGRARLGWHHRRPAGSRGRSG